MGCDTLRKYDSAEELIFSIHAPRVGCDGYAGEHSCHSKNFNPRTPGGVRRWRCDSKNLTVYNFNPRTPGGVRHRRSLVKSPRTKISIHAPRVGCDLNNLSTRCRPNVFQSTHPGWGATMLVLIYWRMPKYFNPRTPGGVRPGGHQDDRADPYDFNPRTPGGVRRVGGHTGYA